ncbi:MAG TPA: sterol desaturase family protein [Terriglobales bacterium]|nr:sterol desaturase family protein [Terriglobales bacterium]
MKGLLKIAGLLGLLGGLIFVEHRNPLRREKESKGRRNSRNLAVATLGALTLHFAESPVLYPLAKRMQDRRWGVLKWLRLPRVLESAVAVLLLDYTHYIQHVLHHRVPFLWRFHAVHHVDLDLDASTALRFHFGEIALSIPYRVAQVFLIGVDPRSLLTWQTLTLFSILFHHSNLRLPKSVEDRLVRFVVTPRMHGIHHSKEPQDQNSNWSGGLTLWDALHGTLNLGVPQREIDIGVPGFERPEQVTLPKILTQPFRDEPAVRAFLEAGPNNVEVA